MARLKEIYKKEVVPALTAQFGYKSAMQVPRIHHQYTPDVVHFEPGTPAAILAALSVAGFRLREQRALGIGAGIKWLSDTNELGACLDPRFGASE